MTRSSMGTSVLFLMWMAALTAQQQPAPTTEPAHKVYVLTGCLEAGTATSSFRLAGGTAVGQAPPARTPSASSAETTGVYLLEPVSSIGEQGISRERLQGQVGARVEVTVRPVRDTSEHTVIDVTRREGQAAGTGAAALHRDQNRPACRLMCLIDRVPESPPHGAPARWWT